MNDSARRFLTGLLLALCVAACGAPTPQPGGAAPPGPTASTPTRTTAEAMAVESLSRYFALLATGRYAAAAPLYGGDGGMLREWNPEMADDNASLLQAGCERQLYPCRSVASVVGVRPTGEREWVVTVTFANPDGTLFVLGPCCGASPEEMPPQSEFDYTVRQQGEGFVVMELPPYVP